MSVYAQPKPQPDRDPAYRAWLREHCCVVCGSLPYSEVHHLDSSGMGTKGSDYEAIPVCRQCHDLLGERRHEILKDKYGWDDAYGWRISGWYYRQWIKEKLGDYVIAKDGETLVYDGPKQGGNE